MSIEVNGVTLPDIPSDVHPYAVIIDGTAMMEAQGMTGYHLYVLQLGSVEFEYLPAGAISIITYPVLRSLGAGCQYQYVPEEMTDWNLENEDEESIITAVGEMNGISIPVIWANHDVMALDATGNPTGEVYFPSNAVDPNYYAPKSWYDGMARQVMRLTGTSDKLTTDEMLAGLKDYEGGITLGPYDSIMRGGGGVSTLDMSGLLTSSAS